MERELAILEDRIIELALLEDVSSGDLATGAIVPTSKLGQARLVAKADGVVSGLWVAERVFQRMDVDSVTRRAVADGDTVRAGDTIAEVSGSYSALLTGERVALNFLQRMSGIATMTRAFVARLEGTHCRVLDTRKTAPGQRVFDKRAVRDGGGANHRMGLYDMAMIKDNHIAMAGGITAAVQRVRAMIPVYAPVEVETTTLDEVQEALRCGVEVIMLDNMPLNLMRDCVRLINGRAKVEASGNVTLERVREIAETGVDFVSVGALTHSVKALDISMRLLPA